MPATTRSNPALVAPNRRRIRAYIPPQHGAWAFLVVPLLVGFALAGVNPAGLLLAAAWVAAYPVSYFAGRAVTIRVRRGSWTRLARREAGRTIPWAVALVLLSVPLVGLAPWLLGVGALLGLAWSGSLALAARFGERSLVNDLALVGQAMCAVPLLWAVVATSGGIAGIPAGAPIWTSLQLAPPSLAIGTLVVGVELFGSVLAVKSVLRQAGNRRFRAVSVGYHLLALAATSWIDPAWWLAFAPALGRSILLRPGMRPPVIGAVEAAVASLLVVAAFVSL